MKPELKIRKTNKKTLAEAMGCDFSEAMATVVATYLSGESFSTCLSKLWDRASTPEEAMLLAFFLGKWAGFLEREFPLKEEEVNK